MKRKYRILIYFGTLFFIIVLTFTATWIFLAKINGDPNIYQFNNSLKKEIYTYKDNTFYYGPKDDNSDKIDYNNAIIRKNKNEQNYKLIVVLNDEENTLMKDNYLFDKNYFYLIGRDITIYDITIDKPEESKRVYSGYFNGNARVTKIYGIKKDWLYIKVKLFKESDNHNWYEDRYYKINCDKEQVYEIPQSLLPEFK